MTREETLEQVATLFPYISFGERIEWCSRLKHWFDGDFGACANDLIDRSERITGEEWPSRQIERLLREAGVIRDR